MTDLSKLVYYKDCYLKELSCTAVSAEKTEKALKVITDKTVFYPECGGQPGDIGYLGSEEVLDTQKADDGNSVLYLNPNADIQVGKEYLLKLNWEHRYKYMVMHTCQHMTSGLLYYMFNIGTVSVHLGEDYFAIETDQSSVSRETIDKLLETENRKIAQGHKIVYHEVSQKEARDMGLRRSVKVEGDVRIVEIQDTDRIACGGVHIASVSEIGLVTYLGQEQIRGHVRLFLSCGETARESACKNQKILSELNEELSCSFEDLPKNIKIIQEDLTKTKSENLALAKKLASYVIDKNIKNNVAVFEETDSINLQAYAACVPSYENLALCIVQKNSQRLNWMIALKGSYEKTDFAVIKEKLFPIIDAKGGGRNPVFQGVGNLSDSDSINRFSEEFKNLL